MGDSKFDIAFIDVGYIWSQAFMDQFIGALNQLELENGGKNLGRSFSDMKIEILNAYRELQLKIRDIPLIMKCRVKCDANSNFGGLQCSIFAGKIEYAISKYLKTSEDMDLNDVVNKNLVDGLNKIKDKASDDKNYAYDFEKETKQKYLMFGKDNTLEIFKKSGYTFD